MHPLQSIVYLVISYRVRPDIDDVDLMLRFFDEFPTTEMKRKDIKMCMERQLNKCKGTKDGSNQHLPNHIDEY